MTILSVEMMGMNQMNRMKFESSEVTVLNINCIATLLLFL